MTTIDNLSNNSKNSKNDKYISCFRVQTPLSLPIIP